MPMFVPSGKAAILLRKTDGPDKIDRSSSAPSVVNWP